MSKPKILVLDIETAPALVWTWGLRDQNHGIEQIKQDQHCLMWVAKEVGGALHYDHIMNHTKEYKADPISDKSIALTIQPLLDSADIVVTQNGDSFDLKWLNTLFLKHDIQMPSPYYSVDLLKESRRSYFSLSHRLDFRGRQLGLGGKMPHEGFRLWLSCMEGDERAFRRMLAYCKRDVLLTEEYYLKLKPRMKNHPNVNMWNENVVGGRLKCPACSSTRLLAKGFRYLTTGRKQRFKCQDCGHYSCSTLRADDTYKVLLKTEK